MTQYIHIFWCVLLMCIFTGCGTSSRPVQVPTVTIFVAASLAGIVHEIIDSYEIDNKVDVVINSAGSGTLAMQIAQGATADIYISANESWMDYIQGKQKTSESDRSSFLQNQLVVVSALDSFTHRKSDTAFDTLLKVDSLIAIGDANYVPAGMYAKQALANAGLWKPIQSRIITARDVQSALHLVERREVDYGIVYLTDALASDKVKVLEHIPSDLHEVITYSVAKIDNNRSEESNIAVDALVRYLNSDIAIAYYEEAGFVSVGAIR